MKGKRDTLELEKDRLAIKLAELVEIFRKGKKASDFNWWQDMSILFRPYFGYQDGKPIFEEVTQGVLKLNPEMLSEYGIKHKLVYDFLQNQTIDYKSAEHLYNQELVSEARRHLNELIKFESWQNVDIPIANLWYEGEPVDFHHVTFREVTKAELKLWKDKLKTFWHEGASNVNVLARVWSPGDRTKAISYARNQVDEALEIMRAFSFPFGRDSIHWRIGVVGEIISSTSTPMSIGGKAFFSRIGVPVLMVELKEDILSKIEKSRWGLISDFIAKKRLNKMEKKLHDSIHWLAESTKPDTNNSKFIKIAIALETLIGGEPRDEELKIRGITAMLAERAAFILGEDLGGRRAIDKDIRRYYNMRGKVVHGGEGDISLDDIDGFGELVRHLALAMLGKLDELKGEMNNVDRLQEWVEEQKYTLPQDGGKEVSNVGG